jgi:hypothetical protein
MEFANRATRDLYNGTSSKPAQNVVPASPTYDPDQSATDPTGEHTSA